MIKKLKYILKKLKITIIYEITHFPNHLFFYDPKDGE